MPSVRGRGEGQVVSMERKVATGLGIGVKQVEDITDAVRQVV